MTALLPDISHFAECFFQIIVYRPIWSVRQNARTNALRWRHWSELCR